jgi:hypothetical protein
MSDLYEQDFYLWTIEQGVLLRAGKLDEADIENVAEEIESVGRNLIHELTDRMAQMLRYMLHWQHQPENRTQDLQTVLSTERTWIKGLLEQSPSLAEFIPEELQDSYESARRNATYDMDIEESAFPDTCPWTFEQMMDFDIRL